MRGRRVWTAVAGLALLLAVGCGGGGPTTEEFVEEANTICEEHRAVIEEASSEMMGGGQMPDPEAFGRFAQETLIPELNAQFEELRELEPSQEVADAFESYLSEGEQAVQQIQEDPRFLTDAANFEEVNRQADEAGLSDACHIGPG